MKYLLLMYHPESYWRDQSDARDHQEGAAFAGFCQWMREQGIGWGSHALTDDAEAWAVRPGEDGQHVETVGPFAELSDVITGLFILDVRTESQAVEAARRCPVIGGAGVELRKIAG